MIYGANLALQRDRARPKADIRSVPAPVGGWNTRDALDAMDPKDAIVLDNLFPTVGSVDLRKGSESHATGVGAGDVETVIEYNAITSRHLIAAGGGALYNATSPGAATSLASGFTNNRWQGVNFNAQLHLVNGQDDPRMYDGATVTAPAWSGVGLTISTLVGVVDFKNRLYFWPSNSQDFWYGGLDAVTGTLTKFPLSRVGEFGGNIVAIGRWTRDAGDGADDLFVVIMSSGEAIVYQGTDPSSSTTWALEGVYRIGAPIGVRCVAKVAGDLIIATKEDYVALSRVINRERTGQDETKIAGAAKDAADAYSSNFGWQVLHYAGGNQLIVNVPVNPGTTYNQHVLNTLTGAWCRFTGLKAICWTVFNDALYFGGTLGRVYRADKDYDDNGDAIAAEARTAWNNFRQARDKMVTAVRPVISAAGTLDLSIGLAFDFKDVAVDQASSSATEGPPWDTSDWDTTDWAPEGTARDEWLGASGNGHSVSLRMRFSSMGQAIRWFRTDYLIRGGGAL